MDDFPLCDLELSGDDGFVPPGNSRCTAADQLSGPERCQNHELKRTNAWRTLNHKEPLSVFFNKISVLLRRGFGLMVTQSTRGTVPAPAHASGTCLARASRNQRCPRELAIAFRGDGVERAEDLADVSCALRSVAEVGLSARTRKNGALLERWRAQCGLTSSTIHDLATPQIRRCPAIV